GAGEAERGLAVADLDRRGIRIGRLLVVHAGQTLQGRHGVAGAEIEAVEAERVVGDGVGRRRGRLDLDVVLVVQVLPRLQIVAELEADAGAVAGELGTRIDEAELGRVGERLDAVGN